MHFGQLIYATHKLDVFLPPQGFSEFAPMVPLSSKVSREQRPPWFIEQYAITEFRVKIEPRTDVAFRKELVERIGLGFEDSG
jgi:hypothetical protein